VLQRIGWERGGPTDPYCVLASASGNYYIKTGGERSVTCGWDGGAAKDKCCRTAMGPDGWYIESFRRRFTCILLGQSLMTDTPRRLHDSTAHGYCRSKPGNCRWLNKTACAEALPLVADPRGRFCLPCGAGVVDSGCPSGNWTPGPPPPPPVPAVG
jgi:hypothetical protein